MVPRRFRNHGPINQELVNHLIRENRGTERLAPLTSNISQRNHEQVTRTLYITFDLLNHIPITHHHLTQHFESFYPSVRVAEVQMQQRTPTHARCAWVVLHSVEDMVEVLGEDLQLVMDVTVLSQELWMRPQTCKCPLCYVPRNRNVRR